jgi:nucleoside-diphosphate-sugar epimerase
MQVFIAGVDGYLGWALAQYLVARGHEVAGCDNYFRRDWIADLPASLATCLLILSPPAITLYQSGMPSAPYSMVDVHHCIFNRTKSSVDFDGD